MCLKAAFTHIRLLPLERCKKKLDKRNNHIIGLAFVNSSLFYARFLLWTKTDQKTNQLFHGCLIYQLSFNAKLYSWIKKRQFRINPHRWKNVRCSLAGNYDDSCIVHEAKKKQCILFCFQFDYTLPFFLRFVFVWLQSGLVSRFGKHDDVFKKESFFY